MSLKPRVVIAGGGWAGLAAAVELCAHGVPVHLFESARQLGGRARSVRHGDDTVDNGQHLLIGGYTETLRLLNQIGIREDQALLRRRLRLSMHDLSGGLLDVAARPAPAPFHLGLGLLLARGLNGQERFQALRMSFSLYLSGFQLRGDTTLSALLERFGQSERLVKYLWEPLCLGAMNTLPEEASASAFLTVLRDTFARRARHSDLLIPRVGLSALFPEAAADFIRRTGGIVETGKRVTGLQVDGGRLNGAIAAGESIRADHIILATAPVAAGRLLAQHEPLRPLGDRLKALAFAPITTVYLRFAEHTELDPVMSGCVGSTSQWLFDRRVCGQKGVLAVVISGDGPYCHWSRKRLIDEVKREVARRFPSWPPPLEAFAIREARATIKCTVDQEPLRPGNATGVSGLWLAGDYTATGYPATLEGAVRSGVQCANLIINAHTNSESPCNKT